LQITAHYRSPLLAAMARYRNVVAILPGNRLLLADGTSVDFPTVPTATIRATPVDGSVYPWGDTAETVTIKDDGSWAIAILGIHITAIDGGFSVVAGR
jgi:hypothetical protein